MGLITKEVQTLQEIQNDIWRAILKEKDNSNFDELKQIIDKLSVLIDSKKKEVKQYNQDIHSIISMKDIQDWIMEWSIYYQKKFNKDAPPIEKLVAERCCQSIHSKMTKKLRDNKFQ